MEKKTKQQVVQEATYSSFLEEIEQKNIQIANQTAMLAGLKFDLNEAHEQIAALSKELSELKAPKSQATTPAEEQPAAPEEA